MDIIWGSMVLLGVIFAIAMGKITEVSEAFLQGGRDAVQLCVTMAGIMAMWTGLMKIAEEGGMIQMISKKLQPLLKFLFPDIPSNDPANKAIATNLTANFLGLGWAATPAGLNAMKELDRLNHYKKEASHAMCMFLIINMSSVQLFSVNLIAYRAEYGSIAPMEIVGAGIIATLISTLAGVIFALVMERRKK